MAKHHLPHHDRVFWSLPGGGVEPRETPAEAAIRELKEECLVDGVIIKELRIDDYTQTTGLYNWHYTYLVDIGDQEPSLGTDPDIEDQVLVDLKWLTLKQIYERDRVFLFSAGLLSIEPFRQEVIAWGNDISYPGR